MALVDARGFDLNPRIGQGLARGIQTLGQFQLMGQRNLQAQREAGVREALGGAPQMQPQTQQQQQLAEQTEGLGGALAQAEQPQPVTTQEEKIEIARQIDPAIANKQLKALGLDSASKRAEMSRFAAKIESLPPEQRFAEIEKRSQELDAQGRDSSQTRMLLDMDQETQDRALLGVQLMDLTTKERLGIREKIAKRAGEIEEVSEVQSSKILPGGLVQIVRKDGTTEVIPAKEAEQLLVKEAETRGAELQGLRAGERGAAAESQKLAITSFKKLAPIKKSIRNLERGIELIDEGAKTGVVAGRLPSVRQASIELDNIQNQMGLDVIGTTTFGALSESELAFALSTALPKKLKGPALRGWMVRKRDAQRKLADYVEEAAIFLGTPGNTMSRFLQMKKDQQAGGEQTTSADQETPAPAKQRIRFDAQGNIIQ